MDPREASIVVAGRRDLADVTFSTWVRELRRMATRLEPAERAGFVGLFSVAGNGPQQSATLIAVTSERLLVGHSPDGPSMSLDDISWVEGAGKTTTLTLSSGERIELESAWNEETADGLRAALWGPRPQPGAAEAVPGASFQPWEPTPEQGRYALRRSVLRPVMLLGVFAVAAFLTIGVGLVVKEALGFDWWGAVALPVLIATTALLALIGARVGRRDLLFDAMHRDATATLTRAGG